MANTIITLKYARDNNLAHYFTGKLCSKGHIDIRLVLNRSCTECNRIKTRKRNKTNPLNIEQKKDKSIYYKKWYEKNREKQLVNMREYQSINKDILSIKSKEYYNKNKSVMLKKSLIYQKAYYKTTKGKLIMFCRNSLRRLLDLTGSKASIENYNYSIEDLKAHIENQFDVFMTWGNYGLWHIDHVTPIVKIVEDNISLGEIDLLNKVNNLNNLQPLWASDNLKKGVSL